MCVHQPRLNYNRRTHTNHIRDTAEAPDSGDHIVPLGPTEHLLYKYTPLRLEDITAIHNTQKQIQESSQNERTK